MEASLQELKSSQRMVPRAVHLPNCDRKGFYKRKQVRCSPLRKAFLCRCPGWEGWRFFLCWVGWDVAASISRHVWWWVALLMAPSAIWPEASILKELVREGGKVREPWGGVAVGMGMCLKQRAGARSYPGGCITGVKGVRPDPQGGSHSVWWPTPNLCPWVSPQCKPSRGRKRGLCWCVDKYGMKLPGTDFLSGDLQCHAFDSSNVE